MSNARPSATAASQSFAAPSEPPPLYERRDLPAGWIKEHDPQSDRDYYVDTLAQPPRSIWVHPLDDPDFVRTHRGDDDSDFDHSEDHHSQRPPSSQGSHHDVTSSEYPEDKKTARRDHDHLEVPSTAGAGSSKGHSRNESNSSANSVNSATKKRGFFGKLKDKALGTPEEREAARKEKERRRKEEERLYYERRAAMLKARQQEMEAQRAAYEQIMRQQQQQYQQGGYPGQQRIVYGRPAMNAFGGPTYQDPYAYGASPYGRRGGGFGGGGLGGGGALLGGLAGGLLLGDLLGGGF